MGICYNCGTQITLKENQTHCDKCGNIVWYICWCCKQGFKTADEKGKKRSECKICGSFYCPNCGICKENCDKGKWAAKIKEIIPTYTEEQIKQIIDLIENIKTSNVKMSCIRNVPITYAKGRIKNLLAKTEGFRTKNKYDIQKFIERREKLIAFEIGSSTTINQIRAEGTYGQEDRDALNSLVCLGIFSITWIEIRDAENKPTGSKYALYTRIEGNACKYLSKEDLVINECVKCKTQYPRGVLVCAKCHYKQKAKKGEPYPTKERLSTTDLCQMYRGDFKKK